MPTIQDFSYEERVYNLITEIFLLNNIGYDPTDYSVTSVEQNISNIPSNTVIKLAPINTNLTLENLVLYYNRVEIETLVQQYNLSIPVATVSDNAYKLLPVLNNKLIGSNFTIDENDVYNTFVATQPSPDNAFLVLSALPESFFYVGDFRVPVNFVPTNLSLSFKIEIEDKNTVI